MSRPHELDILIVGGGLAGLTLASYLARQGQRPRIVEQASDWSGTGYGIGHWKDGLAVLDELGSLETVQESAADPHGFGVRDSNAGLLTCGSLPPDKTLLWAIHRGDLHAALRDNVPTEWISIDTEPDRIDARLDEVAVTFDHGVMETFDLVVGADGVHSTVREQCFTDWTLTEHDTYIWSLWASQDVDLRSDMVCVWGFGNEGFVARVGDRVGFNLAARPNTPCDPPARME